MIGVFDSGIGGLTVVRALRKKLPGAHILYVGDVARMPYGNKSSATVTEYAREITRYLVRRGAKLIVIACNTASAMAADALREEFSVPILDVISPAVREALGPASRAPRAARRIAVLGTRGTIASNAYQRQLPVVAAVPCPIFVPMVEEGYAGTAEAQGLVSRNLKPLVGKRIDTVVLGCTHYPLLRKEVAAILPMARLVDSSAVAEDVKRLVALDPRAAAGRGPKLEVVVTDRTPYFEKFARRILGAKLKLKLVTPEELIHGRPAR
jgi:glutamate racemase